MSSAVLKKLVDSFERRALWCGIMVVAGLVIEVALAFLFPHGETRLEIWGPIGADTLVALGVFGEVLFARKAKTISEEVQRESDERVAASESRAAEALQRAEEERHARAKLEEKLQPRSLNQDQWDFIQGLRGKFPIVSIAYETDAETWWFAGQIRDAFFSAGISVAMYPRAADVHSFGTFIFEPNGFEGARPRTAEPLVEIFRIADSIGSMAVITELPTDVVLSIGNTRPEMRAPLDTPMIIVGGRFVLPPPHIEKAAMAAKATMDKMRNDARIAGEPSI